MKWPDRGPLDKETGYLIEEIVKHLKDTQAALLLLRNVHNTTQPLFSLGGPLVQLLIASV